MEPQGVERRLTTILSADVVGYSRLMAADEAGTLAQLKTHRKELIEPKTAQYHGRVVKLMGDGTLMEFGSVVDAVLFAVDVQREMEKRNAAVPKDRQITSRVGINIGDIIVDGDDIYGDGVNVAARLQELADPGGVCISGKVYEEVKHKLELGYEDLGAQEVKNIPDPIRVYRVLMEPGAVGKVVADSTKRPRPWKWPAIAAALVVLVAAGGMVAWLQPWAPAVEPASVERMAFPLPQKPSIAVLAFDNLTGDPGQDYFSDGITESIITTLSKIPDLFVIARNSTFTYKGMPVKVQRVAEELGVRYVLEGSVQRSGDKVRITAQLVDAITGGHLWSDRYDRDLHDLFTLQDEITRRIVTELQVELTEGEQARVWRRETDDAEAYEYYLRGVERWRQLAKADNAEAQRLLEKAVGLDSGFVAAWVDLARTHYFDARFGWSEARDRSVARAAELAEKALAMDDSRAETYAMLTNVALLKGQHDQAMTYCDKALALNPNAQVTALCARNLGYVGRPQESLTLIKRATRLSPYYPDWYLTVFGNAHRMMGNYDEAIAALKGWRDRNPDSPFPHMGLAATFGMAGREEEARAAVAEVLKRDPKWSVKRAAKVMFYKDPAETERILDALRKAGLPENPPLPLPDKPSIAVLPFTNMSGDPEQEYFADGMAEDIITDLSKISGLFVIARNSSFAYRNKDVDVKQVARELGVKYLLEGSVRRAGDQVRINAQLIDATTGGHLWAERYDRDLKDIFALQDEIEGKIVAALEVKLTETEQERIARRYTENLEAYDYFLRGREFHGGHTKERNAQARQLLERAIELDPKFAGAYAELSWIHFFGWASQWSDAPQSLDRALEMAQRAVALDDSLPDAHARLGFILVWKKQYQRGITEGKRAIALDPNYADGYLLLGHMLIYGGGSAEEAIRVSTKGMRLDPYSLYHYLLHIADGYWTMGQYDEALANLKRSVTLKPDFMPTHLWLAVVYGELGRVEEARAEVAEVLRVSPRTSVESQRKRMPYKEQAVLDRFIVALRKAGLPE